MINTQLYMYVHYYTVVNGLITSTMYMVSDRYWVLGLKSSKVFDQGYTLT